MMSSKVKEDEFNIKLIQLIEQRPWLYDYNRSDYSNRNVQDAAWLEISKKTNESVADCKERWKNLRGCYTRHLKKMNRPSGSSAKYVKPYYLANQLQFLDRYTKSRPPKGIFKTEESKTGLDQETQNDVDDYSDNSENETPSPSPSPADKVEATYWDAENVSRSKEIIKKPKKVSLSEVNASALEFFKSRQKKTKYHGNQDPDFAFLYSLLPDLKDMNRVQKRKFKMGALLLVSDLLEENTQASTANTSNQPAL